MKKSLLASTAMVACLAVATVATEVNAEGPYVSLFGGVNFMPDTDTAVGPDYVTEADFDEGFVVGGAAGFAFDSGFRVEGEVAYRRNSMVTADYGGGYTAEGDMDALSLMVNVWYDFKTGTNSRVFVGGGIGGAIVGQDDVKAYGYPGIDDDDVAFAYQVGAGVALDLGRADLTLEYRYFATSGVELEHPYSGYPDVDTDFQSHSVMVGFSFPLGGQ